MNAFTLVDIILGNGFGRNLLDLGDIETIHVQFEILVIGREDEGSARPEQKDHFRKEPWMVFDDIKGHITRFGVGKGWWIHNGQIEAQVVASGLS